jgi:muramoyltetrapeptide carboxypeptidase
MKVLNATPIIDIIAPAGRIKSPAEIPAVENRIKQWGFQPRFGKNVFGDHSFLSNTTEKRFQDLKNALYATDAKVIWCYRGGSGCAELLPLLTTLPPPLQEKIFLGFSDITSLLIFLHEKWGWNTYHGPGARQILPGILEPPSLEAIKNLFLHNLAEVWIDDFAPINTIAQKPFEITAPIIGGNLAVIAHSLGTPYQPNPANKILLLEDVNEQAYKIRRMLTQLTQAGLFSNIQALILGNFLCNNDEEKDWINTELVEFAAQQIFPVLQTCSIGHGKQNALVPFGNPIILTHQKLRSVSYERAH